MLDSLIDVRRLADGVTSDGVCIIVSHNVLLLLLLLLGPNITLTTCTAILLELYFNTETKYKYDTN